MGTDAGTIMPAPSGNFRELIEWDLPKERAILD